MKLIGTDFSAKWINFKLDGKYYSIHFKDSFLKGTYEVTVWEGNNGKGYFETNAEIESTFYPLKRRILEFWKLLSICIKLKLKKLSQ